MRITRVAVLAGKLAPSIRIDRPREGKIASAYHAAEQRSRPERKVFNVVALAQRLAFGGDSRDADEFRVGAGFTGQREKRKSRHQLYSLFVRLQYRQTPSLSNPKKMGNDGETGASPVQVWGGRAGTPGAPRAQTPTDAHPVPEAVPA